MNIVASCEQKPETRVALTPSVVRHYQSLGHQVFLEQGAGELSGFSDQMYEACDVSVDKPKSILSTANVLLSVNVPTKNTLKYLAPNTLIISQFENDESAIIDYCLANQLSLINMKLMPRISRAQNMDTLSSQSNLAGYKAVLMAVNAFQRVVPMMMTAAGMIHPAKVLILGAGVAGLQAIATAKRIGAAVYAFDVRRAAKEQVESLSAEFVEVSDEDMEGEGGYAGEASDAYKQKQAALIHEHAQQADMIITTALIPNRPAPILIQEETVRAMKPGSVIVDMATARGGNCALSENDKVVVKHGVTIMGYSNLAGLVPATASELYANNLLQLVKLISDDGQIKLNADDTVLQHTLICHQGQTMPFMREEQPA
ncbi:Re/Si-specific NAD(P)(+) transhydrogenase subunit alpha [Legionella sp. W05-934-2]|jgi:NAD(P) transhydrogenase subunit alpha|uniref:Re/Si-specific NAD(P)(+) transhydrogenase subunit alpha n=1 Tax=Legionella sp. W05-934-2 TaxID=1198649 RepID=UPI003461D654